MTVEELTEIYEVLDDAQVVMNYVCEDLACGGIRCTSNTDSFDVSFSTNWSYADFRFSSDGTCRVLCVIDKGEQHCVHPPVDCSWFFHTAFRNKCDAIRITKNFVPFLMTSVVELIDKKKANAEES